MTIKGHEKDDVSRASFRVDYLRRSRKIWRKHSQSKPWLDQMYRTFLHLGSRQTIVDIGCGHGDFTRQLAKLSNARTKIIGIDSDPKAIEAAVADTKKARLSRTVSYKTGDAYNIPCDDNFADMTCCRLLLMHLTDPLRAVREMMRVTKRGGQVVALEQGRMSSYYDPNDEEYSRLADAAYEAWIKGIRKLEGKEFRIGEKLPDIFCKAGLSNIQAEIQSDAFLHCDSRRALRDTKEDLRFGLTFFKGV